MDYFLIERLWQRFSHRVRINGSGDEFFGSFLLLFSRSFDWEADNLSVAQMGHKLGIRILMLRIILGKHWVFKQFDFWYFICIQLVSD